MILCPKQDALTVFSLRIILPESHTRNAALVAISSLGNADSGQMAEENLTTAVLLFISAN